MGSKINKNNYFVYWGSSHLVAEYESSQDAIIKVTHDHDCTIINSDIADFIVNTYEMNCTGFFDTPTGSRVRNWVDWI